jgi:hypothetical protein
VHNTLGESIERKGGSIHIPNLLDHRLLMLA